MSSASKEPLLEKDTILNGKWEIIDHIATGGMAEVYRARQISLDREVAVKILSQGFLESLEGDEEEIQSALGRFHREVKAMALVRHPNVLQVYDQDRAVLQVNGKEMAIEYIAMEYIPGPNLRSTMPAEGLRDNDRRMREWIRRYFMPILDGVETVHALGIVHRDLKPQNVLLDGFTPKIMDFGLAGGRLWTGLTQDHHMFGTMQYMAPEQLVDLGETDARGDIYSLGKILYEAVSGEMTKETAFPLKTAHIRDPHTPFLRRLDRIIQQATAEDRKERMPSVAVFRKVLKEALEEENSTAPRPQIPAMGLSAWRPRLLIGALLVIAAASVVFHVLYHHEQKQLSAGTPPPSPSESLPEKVPAQIGLEASPAKGARFNSLTIKERDGATMMLVPAGEVTLPKGFGASAGKLVKVEPFYMDETEVTNHQYVEFLNQVLKKVRVQGDVVRGNGEIWLLLGKVMEGYEPIGFRDGKFYLKDAALASNPVVRVTGYGASAYARFYGRRLPTDVEWFHAARGDGSPKSPSRDTSPSREPTDEEGGSASMEEMHEQMMQSSASAPRLSSKIPAPVTVSKPNEYGIRGLNGNVGEWGEPILAKTEGAEYVILGGSGDESGGVTAIPREPWEAFENVSFRTALSAPLRKDKRDG